MDGGVLQVEGLHAVGALDAQQAVGRAHVAKKEFAAGPDLQDARDFRRRPDGAISCTANGKVALTLWQNLEAIEA